MTERTYKALRTADRVEQFTQRIIDQKKPFGFDIEAGYIGEDRKDGALIQYHPDYRVTGISFTNSFNWAVYIPFDHDDGDNVDDLPRTLRALWRMLYATDDNGEVMGVAHNVIYEMRGLRKLFADVLWNDPEVGEHVRAENGFFPFLADTMIEVWLEACYDAFTIGKDLKSVSEAAFGLKMTHFPDLFPLEDSDMGPATPKAKQKFKRFNTRSSRSKAVIDYACEDSVACLMIHYKHYDNVKDKFIWQVEHALPRLLVEMEMEGMYLDWDEISRKAVEVDQFRSLMGEDIAAELSKRVNRTLNLNLRSVQQLQAILFEPAPEGLGLPIKLRSKKTQKPSTGEKALRAIAKVDPIIARILEWRQIDKLYGSYLHKYEMELNYTGDDRAHPHHNQAGALTGRFSVDHVSYQQWPKPYLYKLDSGKTFSLNFRDLFLAPKDFRIVGYDFSQVELRVLAGISNETTMIQAFADGIDIHRATAASMFSIPVETVTKDLRAKGKTGNFAVVFGSGAQNMADMMGTSKEEAEELLKAYYAGFPNLRKWMDKSMATGGEQHYVETLFGRKFTIWEYDSKNSYIHSKGDRMCINAPVQGGAADYMKIGMVRVRKALRKAEASGRIPVGGIRLITTVHDALEFYVHKNVATQTVIDIITPAVSFPIKKNFATNEVYSNFPEIRTDWHEGFKWGSVAEIKLDTEGKIHAFGLEDVDEEFTSLEEALAFLEKKKMSKEELERLAAESNILAVEDDEEDTVISQWADPIEETDLDIDAFIAEREMKLTISNNPDASHLTMNTISEMVADSEDEPPWLHSPADPEQEFPVQFDPIFKVKTERIQVKEMPTAEQFDALKEFFLAHVGQNRVVISLPDGDMTMPYRVNLLNADTAALNLIINGAQRFYEPEDVFIGVQKAEAVGA